MKCCRARFHLLALALLVGAVSGAFAQAPAKSDYKIQPEDLIKIFVFDEPSLTMTNRVQGSGTFTYPLLGALKVAGKTAGQVQVDITKRLAADYLVNPQVIVQIMQYKEQMVSVVGEVRIPGAIALPSEKKMDVPEAIARAGGLTPNAKKKSIELWRDGRRQTFSYKELLKMKDPAKKIYLKSGDTIQVPARFF